jgi:hypothetical protein
VNGRDDRVSGHLPARSKRRETSGSTTSQTDLGATEPIEPLFPNAHLLVQQSEVTLLEHLHSQQRRWYQPGTYLDLRTKAILLVGVEFCSAGTRP